MYHNRLFYNILLSFSITVFLTSCAQLPSRNNVQKDEEVGFPAKISLISLAKGFGSFDKITPDNNDCVVIDKKEPEKSEKIFNDLVKKLINDKEEKAVRKTGLDEAQIKEAFNLVKSGEFKGDVEYTFISLVRNVRDLQSSFKTRFVEISRDPLPSFDLILNSPQYLQINPKSSFQCEEGIRKFLAEQNYDNIGACAPGAVGKILDKLKKDETTSIAIETARIFTNEDNRSSRLAIIAYAKMYGIKITEDDLDKLDGFIETSNESDLTPLIKVGIDKLAERYGVKDIQSLIKKKDNECSLS